MFDIGFWELLLIGVVALLIVGPERLPKFARVTGMWLGRAQASIRDVKNDISRELRAEDLKQSLKEPFEDLQGLRDLPDLKDIIEMEAEDEMRAEIAQEVADNNTQPAKSKIDD